MTYDTPFRPGGSDWIALSPEPHRAFLFAFAAMADSDRDIEEKIDSLRALVLSRHQHIPEDALWTVKEACVRLRGINPHALTDAELAEKLSEDRTMHPRTFQRKYLYDEGVRVWAVDTGSRGKRIPEKLLRQELDRRVEAGKPKAYAQM